MGNKKAKLSPIVIVICTALILVSSLITVFAVSKHDSDDNEYRDTARLAAAKCLDKEEYTSTDDGVPTRYYRLFIEFDAGHGMLSTEITSDDPSYNTIDVNSEFDVYYQTDDPYNCRPAFTFPNRTRLYVFLGILSAVSIVLMIINIITIIRNIHGYQPAFEKPDDIGTFGDINADSGLGDKDRDYSGTNPVNDKIMDSFSDPFATYSGYDENGSGEQLSGEYFDPNAGYSEPPAADYGVPNEGYDLNDPFVSATPGQTPFGGTANYEHTYPGQSDPSLNDAFLTNVSGQQFGERDEQNPDDLFMRKGGDMNDPFVPADRPDPFAGQ